jgi:hypothetical protein
MADLVLLQISQKQAQFPVSAEIFGCIRIEITGSALQLSKVTDKFLHAIILLALYVI